MFFTILIVYIKIYIFHIFPSISFHPNLWDILFILQKGFAINYTYNNFLLYEKKDNPIDVLKIKTYKKQSLIS